LLRTRPRGRSPNMTFRIVGDVRPGLGSGGVIASRTRLGLSEHRGIKVSPLVHAIDNHLESPRRGGSLQIVDLQLVIHIQIDTASRPAKRPPNPATKNAGAPQPVGGRDAAVKPSPRRRGSSPLSSVPCLSGSPYLSCRCKSNATVGMCRIRSRHAGATESGAVLVLVLRGEPAAHAAWPVKKRPTFACSPPFGIGLPSLDRIETARETRSSDQAQLAEGDVERSGSPSSRSPMAELATTLPRRARVFSAV
jgi:hypothetical protein